MTTIHFQPAAIRGQFPSLNTQIDGITPVYFDNPAGMQVPQQVIDAVSGYYRTMNANQGDSSRSPRL